MVRSVAEVTPRVRHDRVCSSGRTAMARMMDINSSSPNTSAMGPAQPKIEAPNIRLTSIVAVAPVMTCRSSILRTQLRRRAKISESSFV
jgi:hypothetical protein